MTDTVEQTLKQGRLRKGRSFPWRLPVVLFIFLLISIVTLWVSNAWLTERFSESMRNKLEVRLTLYSGKDRKSTRLNSSHSSVSRMPSSA